MLKFSKEDDKRRNELASVLETEAEKLDLAIKQFNKEVSELFERKIVPARDDFNEAIAETNGWLEDKACEAQEYYGSKSDAWQESDAGEAYSNWIIQLEEQIEEVTLDAPEELYDVEAIERAEEFRDEDNLPSQPDTEV